MRALIAAVVLAALCLCWACHLVFPYGAGRDGRASDAPRDGRPGESASRERAPGADTPRNDSQNIDAPRGDGPRDAAKYDVIKKHDATKKYDIPKKTDIPMYYFDVPTWYFDVTPPQTDVGTASCNYSYCKSVVNGCCDETGCLPGNTDEACGDQGKFCWHCKDVGLTCNSLTRMCVLSTVAAPPAPR